MILSVPVFLVGVVGLFVVGLVVGSFANLCVARIPWEQSVFWPGSRCDACGAEVKGRDLVPVLGWVGLRGKARCCGASIPGRYPLVELLTASLFVAGFVADWVWAATARPTTFTFWAGVAAHLAFLACLVVISLIDADLTIVPASVTNLGIVVGVLAGAVAPGYRFAPETASTALGGLWTGVLGVLVAAGLVWAIRVIGGLVFRREAMGEGDIHILAVVGAFLGWRIAVMAFFLSSFYGLIPSLWKLVPFLWKRLAGREWSQSERELPLGPYLAMAGASLYLAWPWLWPAVFRPYFAMIESILADAPAMPPEN